MEENTINNKITAQSASNKTIVNNELKANEMFESYPDVVSVEDLMQMLQIGQVLAYKLVKRGEIKSRKVGREYKIPKINVISYLLNGTEVKS